MRIIRRASCRVKLLCAEWLCCVGGPLNYRDVAGTLPERRRDVRALCLVVVSISLGGCFGVTLPPKPLPEWATRSQPEPAPIRPNKPPRSEFGQGAPDRTENVSSQGGVSLVPE